MSNKETIEEAAERIYREYPNNQSDKPEWDYNRDVNCFRKRKAFIKGAQWQAERMYSEEILNILSNLLYWDTCPDDYKVVISNFLKNKTMSNRKQKLVDLKNNYYV